MFARCLRPAHVARLRWFGLEVLRLCEKKERNSILPLLSEKKSKESNANETRCGATRPQPTVTAVPHRCSMAAGCCKTIVRSVQVEANGKHSPALVGVPPKTTHRMFRYLTFSNHARSRRDNLTRKCPATLSFSVDDTTPCPKLHRTSNRPLSARKFGMTRFH